MRYLHCLLAIGLMASLTACDQPKAPATKASTDAPTKTAAGEKKPAATKKPTDTKNEVAKKKGHETGNGAILGVGKPPADIEPGQDNVYGARFTIIEEPIALAKAIADIDKNKGTVKVKASVEKVCQKKGCWFTLKADDVKYPIRVKMKDYAFFVPRNAMGLPAVIEGTLAKAQIPQEEAQHYADDAVEGTGKPAEKITGPQDTYTFMANAIQISRPGT